MTPVICLAHGSRHPAADPAVDRIAAAVADLTGAQARAAHLDFSPATLTTVAAELSAAGHRTATVVPLLFTRAFHMRHDVPAACAAATEATGVELRLTDGIGTGDDLAALLASRIPPGTRRFVLYSVGSTVPGANTTVAGLADRAGRLAGVPEGRTVAVTATGPGDTGPDALIAAVLAAHTGGPDSPGCPDGPVHVAPLFTAPGTLWDLALDALAPFTAPAVSTDTVTTSGAGATVAVTTGVPLDAAVAPIVAERTRE